MKKIALFCLSNALLMPAYASQEGSIDSLWTSLSTLTEPARDWVRDEFRYKRMFGLTEIPGVKYLFYKPDEGKEVVGFSLTNSGSNQINPIGLKKPGAFRNYTFSFADRARENIYLAVNDDVKISRRYSQDNMFREMHFFPRKVIPAIEKYDQGRQLKVTLPTGEPVLFDAKSKEISAGVLREMPIDFTVNRHERKNPELVYKGKNLAITVAQRGESARRAKVWGQVKFAEVHYPKKYDRACRVSPKYIWDQSPKKGDSEPKLTMLHATDHELFSMIEDKCGWDLSELKLAAVTKLKTLAMD
jgi:hypothetical protein